MTGLRSGIGLFGLTLFLLLSIYGCGVKGPLVVKGKPLPSAPGSPMVQQQGSDALLSWSIPTVNQDGTPLDDLKQFAIFRLPYHPGEYCAECRDPSTGHIRIHLDHPEPAIRVENRIYLRDPDLPLNEGYRYRIIPLNSRDDLGTDVVTHLVMLPAPQPPNAPQAIEYDRSLRIKWTSGTRQPDQGQLIGVNIYRAVGDEPFGLHPINSEPLTDEVYNDIGLENNQAYRYGLRNVAQINEQIIESGLSAPVTATPKPLL